MPVPNALEQCIGDAVDSMSRTEQSTTHNMNAELLHAILGIADEAGELVSIAKRKIYYNEDVSLVHVIEELGDLTWYLFLAIRVIARKKDLPVTTVFEAVLVANKAKLQARYPEKYTNELAQEREIAMEYDSIETVLLKMCAIQKEDAI